MEALLVVVVLLHRDARRVVVAPKAFGAAKALKFSKSIVLLCVGVSPTNGIALSLLPLVAAATARPKPLALLPPRPGQVFRFMRSRSMCGQSAKHREGIRRQARDDRCFSTSRSVGTPLGGMRTDCGSNGCFWQVSCNAGVLQRTGHEKHLQARFRCCTPPLTLLTAHTYAAARSLGLAHRHVIHRLEAVSRRPRPSPLPLSYRQRCHQRYRGRRRRRNSRRRSRSRVRGG